MNRLNFIDQAKAIGILLIVLGHISYIWGDVSNFASYFKISIFYVISGYLDSESKRMFDLKSKAKSLLIPYFFYSVIVFLLLLAAGIQKGNFNSLSIFLVETVSLRGWSTLWFLPSLFIALALHKLMHNHINGRNFLLIGIPLVSIVIAPNFRPHHLLGQTVPVATSIFFSETIAQPSFSRYYFSYCVILTLAKGCVAYWFYEVSYIYFKKVLNINKKISIYAILGGGTF